MKHQLNHKFTLSSDNYNWILTEKQAGNKAKRSYFSNFGQLSRFLGDRIARKSVGKVMGDLDKIHAITQGYAPEIDRFARELESYLNSIIEDDKSRFNK